MPVANRTVDELINYLEQFKGRKVFPTEGSVSGVQYGEEHIVLSNILAFWYPEGDISRQGRKEFHGEVPMWG